MAARELQPFDFSVALLQLFSYALCLYAVAGVVRWRSKGYPCRPGAGIAFILCRNGVFTANLPLALEELHALLEACLRGQQKPPPPGS